MFSRRTDWKLAPNRFIKALEQARTSGAEIIDLTISNPTRAGLTYNETAILDSLGNPKSLDYDPQPKGLLDARKAVATYYEERGESVDPESLVLTTGTSEGYAFVFRLLANPGEKVLVAKPSYPLFDFLADLQDITLIPYALIYDHGWQIDFHALERAISEKTRAIVLVHPNNPTGSYVSAAERDQLNHLCQRHGLALIVDEVFLDYSHDDKRRRSFVSNNDILTFTLSGISKVSAVPQMKLAWIGVSGPEAQKRVAIERLEVIADTFLSVSAPVQYAASVLLGQRKKVQPQLVGRVRENLVELDRQLAGQRVCTRLAVEGGWYAVLRVPAIRTDEEQAIRLMRQCRVLVHPGHFYDFDQDGFLIVSLITPEPHFREGVRRILEYLA